MQYPFAMMAKLIQITTSLHQTKRVNDANLYETLDYITDLLRQWNDEQFKEEN